MERAQLEASAGSVLTPPGRRRAADLAYAVAVILVLGLAAQGLFRKITWYLAIDQYGYLTFAGDLARGKVFHSWPPIDDLAGRIPFARVDVLSQTYVFDGDRMYCRYTPGFPILLAAWMRVLGPNAAHYLDPTLFLLLLAVYLALARRLLTVAPGDRWFALAGALLLLLLPSYLHLWAITILRDILAQLLAFGAILAALPRARSMSRLRAAAIGLLFGYLVNTRIDGVLYALPIGGLFLWQRRRAGSAAVAVTLAALGVSPLLAYNYAATGHAFRPTQGMELPGVFDEARRPGEFQALAASERQTVLPDSSRPASTSTHRIAIRLDAGRSEPPGIEVGAAPPAPRALGKRKPALPPVQGGGWRLDNLPRTLPGNVRYVRAAFGNVLLLLAGIGVIGSLLGNRRLLLVTVPYIAGALLFYSCWSRPDPRYIAGLFLLIPLLTLAGVASLAKLGTGGTRHEERRLWRIVAAIVCVALSVLWWEAVRQAWLLAADVWRSGGWGGRSSLPVVSGVVSLVAILACGTSALTSSHRAQRWPATVLATLLLLISVARVVPGLHRPPVSFQGPRGHHDVERARRAIEALIEPGAVVITTTDVGRPAENIDYYTHAHAVYLQDLQRWGWHPGGACLAFLVKGRGVYFLLPTLASKGQSLVDHLREHFYVERLVHVMPHEAPTYFVASRFGTTALDLYRVRLTAAFRERLGRPDPPDPTRPRGRRPGKEPDPK